MRELDCCRCARGARNVSGGGGGSGDSRAVGRGAGLFTLVETFCVTFIMQTQDHEEHQVSNGGHNSTSKGGSGTCLESTVQTRAHTINTIPELRIKY